MGRTGRHAARAMTACDGSGILATAVWVLVGALECQSCRTRLGPSSWGSERELELGRTLGEPVSVKPCCLVGLHFHLSIATPCRVKGDEDR